MRISVKWLQTLVNFDLAPEPLGELLTIAGLEMEELEDRRTWAEGVVLAKVLTREKHPNADKLSVCTVDIGAGEPSTIVCGAPNVRADVLVPVATLGSYLPVIDLKIKPAKLRGVASAGMICSLAELGLSKESEGIHIFEGVDLPLGSPVAPLLALDDAIIEISPTANRADALSMVGVAREVAALTRGELTLPTISEITVTDQSLTVEVAEIHACPAYWGTVIQGVTLKPSPQWLQERLQGAGIRPINNVVDVTNYVLLEWGQPLHGFDYDQLLAVAGNDPLALGVRFAQDGETLVTLDDQTRTLSSQNLLITANNQPVAIAGVMGGAATEVGEHTRNILLEAALFDNVTIRRSSKACNLRSEASTRYERGVNQCELETAMNRAIALILELAGGEVVQQGKSDHRPTQGKAPITLRLSRVQQILGKVQTAEGVGDITAEDVERILEDLGCGLQRQTGEIITWSVTVPSYRQRDIEREIDLIEEVARLYGYDRFCGQLPPNPIPGALSLVDQGERAVREACRALGLTELVHYSLVKPQGKEVLLANPLFAEYAALRTNLLDGLITAFAYNQAQNNGALNGFEIGRVFWHTDDETLEEADHWAGILGGTLTQEGIWTQGGKPQPMDWYCAKGILEGIFQRLGLDITYTADTLDPRLHPGRTALLAYHGQPLGRFGQLHPQLRQEKGLMDEVYGFELAIAPLYSALAQTVLTPTPFQPYSPYPAVERDLALYAPLELTVAQLRQAMVTAGSPLLEQVTLFDEYRGSSVPEGQRSLAFSLAYRAGDRTLTDGDVEPIHNQVREALTQQFTVTLRS